MSKKSCRTDAIVLHALPFRDYDKILTLFTRELGLVKAIARKQLLSKASKGGIDPLTEAEFILDQSQNDLFRCSDLSLKRQNLQLRKEYTKLHTACRMAKTLSASQMAGKPAPLLYQLFSAYLDKLPECRNPEALFLSFMLKLLRHEGLINTEPGCSSCGCPDAQFHAVAGALYCGSHSPPGSRPFSSEEAKLLHTLDSTRSYSELESLALPSSFAERVEQSFYKPFFS